MDHSPVQGEVSHIVVNFLCLFTCSHSNGPVGSALCVYPADNSVETSEGEFPLPIATMTSLVSAGAGRTKSVFDIFREDIASDLTSTAVENQFLEVRS